MTNTIISAYREIRNVKKTAKHLGISQEKVTKILDAAGYPRKKLNITANAKTVCFTCANARADRCAFMSAPMKKTEAALIAMGAEYETRIYVNRDRRGNVRDIPLFTVLRCPKYREGSIAI